MEMVTVPAGVIAGAFVLFLILILLAMMEYFRRLYYKKSQTHILAYMLTLTGKAIPMLLKRDGLFVEVPEKLGKDGKGIKAKRYAITEIACYDAKYPPGPLGFLGSEIPVAVFHERNVEPLAKRAPEGAVPIDENSETMFVPVEVKKDPHKIYVKDDTGQWVEIIVTPELLAYLDKEKVVEAMAKLGHEMEKLREMAMSRINPLVFYICMGVMVVGIVVLGYLVFNQQTSIDNIKQGIDTIKIALGVG